MSRRMVTQQPWPDTMDALLAAPASHHGLLDNGRARVLKVVIEPGAREPERTHRAPSVMMVDEPVRIRYYAGGTLRFESRHAPAARPAICSVSLTSPFKCYFVFVL